MSGRLAPIGGSSGVASPNRAFIADTANRLLATERPESVHARLEDKAKEVAAAVALGAPETFGGFGNEDGDGNKGSMRAPNPNYPVTLMMPKVEQLGLEHYDDLAGAGASSVAGGQGMMAGGGGGYAGSEAGESLASGMHVEPSASSRYAPLKVVLHPAGPRNCVNFVSDLTREPDVAKRNSSLVMFEHIPGAKVHEGLFPAYPLPNGKNTFYYHTGHTLVEEVRVTPDELPDRPVTLELALQIALPRADVLHKLAKPDANDNLNYKPMPALCPLPEKHTLDVNAPDTLEREAFGDLCIRNLQFGCFEQMVAKTCEEDLVTPARFLEPYSVHKSVFVPRLKLADSRDFYDRTPVLLKMFDNDWRHVTNKVKFTTFVRTTPGDDSPEEKLSKCKEVLKDYYDELEGAFRYYSIMGTGDEFSMQLNEFTDFADQCMLPDAKSKFCKRAHIDTLFKAANFEEKAESKEAEMVAKLNDDNALSRFEFVEIIVRVADAKFLKEKICDSLVEAITVMFEEFIIPNLAPESTLDVSVFREERLYTDDVDDAFRGVWDEHLKYAKDGYRTLAKGTQFKALEALYDAFRMEIGGGTIISRKTMQMDQWMYMLGLMGIMDDEDSKFTLREGRLCYVWAQMRVIDDFKDVEKYESLNFIDFLEALARVAEGFPLPALAIIKANGFRSGVEYMGALKADQTDLMLTNRPSRDYMGVKTRPLATKIGDFLDFLFRVVHVHCGYQDEDYTLERALDVFTKLKKRRKDGM